MSDVGGSLPETQPYAPAAITVTGVRWSEVAPWLLLVRALRVAFMARVIVLAILGVLATQAGWALLEAAFSNSQPPPLVRLTDRRPPSLFTINSEIDQAEAFAVFSDNVRLGLIDDADGVARLSDPTTPFNRVDLWPWSGPLVRGWAWAIQPLTALRKADGWGAWLALHVAGVWTIAVWALFGGAIARIAALHLTRGETIGPIAAVKAALAKWPSTAGAPACAYVGLAFLALPLLAAGFVVRLDFFALLIGLVWILVLLVGLAAAVVGLGLLFGWPLMWSTVAVERTDAFDGISRAYAYLYQRPLHALFYLFVAGVLGLVGQTALSTFVDASLASTRWLTGVGAGENHAAALFEGREPPGLLGPPTEAPADAPLPATPTEGDVTDSGNVRENLGDDGSPVGMFGRAGGRVMRFWMHFFGWIASCFPMAYVWPAATGVYLLLRRQIDATDLGEVSYDEPVTDRGLPSLAMDSTLGVPQVVEADANLAAAEADDDRA